VIFGPQEALENFLALTSGDCQQNRAWSKFGLSERVPMPEIKPGNWYFVVFCKNCKAAVAFGDALPAGVVDGIEVDHGPISIHCDACGQDKVYTPQEISIRQAK
jgi:hypothetical protein